MSKTLTDLFEQQAGNQQDMLKNGMYDKFVDNGYQIGERFIFKTLDDTLDPNASEREKDKNDDRRIEKREDYP